MIPFFFVLTLSILLILVFAIPGLFLYVRWVSILGVEDSTKNTGDMKVPTFYSAVEDLYGGASIFVMSAVGVVFGGIHCAGWFFDLPSSDEAVLWRVCSAIITGITFLLPLLLYLYSVLISLLDIFEWVGIVISVLTVVVNVVSRLVLLVEAFISLRHLTPRMLALVKWTSFIPHI